LAADALAQQITGLDFVPRLTIQSELGITNQIQYTNNLSSSNWAVLATLVVTQSPYTFLDLSAPPAPSRFYRVLDPNRPPAPAGMVWIPAGTFTMGSPDSEPAHSSVEGPQTQVTISRGFYMGKYDVTQGEYLALMGSNPSFFITNDFLGHPISPDLNRPVEMVSWNDARNYCATLTERDRNAGRLPAGYSYRLPTEAEWEYACRAGTTTPFHYGNELRSGMANFQGQYEYPPCGTNLLWCFNPGGTCLYHTTPVGSYAPNAWGLYDMHGNLYEWCLDWYADALPGGSVTDPQGASSGVFCVNRGGTYRSFAYTCRSANREAEYPGARNINIGFRVVLAPVQP